MKYFDMFDTIIKNKASLAKHNKSKKKQSESGRFIPYNFFNETNKTKVFLEP